MALQAEKYRIYPNKEQENLIKRTVGCKRFVYNHLLEDYKQQLDNREKPVMKEVTFLKKQFDFLDEVDSLALANAKKDLANAFRNFFQSRNGKRKGKKVRFPKKHKKNKSKLTYTTNNQNGTIRIENGKLKLPKLGFVAFVEHRKVDGTIRSCTVEQGRDGKYYASVLFETEDKPVKAKIKSYDELIVTGIDMSLSGFAVSSDTNDDTKPKFVRYYRNGEKKTKRLQRSVSRKEKGSKNQEKAKKKLCKHCRHVGNQRKDHAHKESRWYADHCDVVVLEDINMQDMARTLHLGKSVNDLGFGMFKQFLAYKCKQTDTAILYADKWFASSKTCHECGSKNPLLKLSDREWVCPECGCVIDRDKNAAMNLRDYFYRVVLREHYNTAGTAEIDASGEVASTLRETLEQAASVNEEAPSFRWG